MLSLLERAGIDAAVDQEILSGDVARLDAAQVGAELAELLGRAEAAGRNRFLDVPPHLFHGLALLLRGELGVALQPVGPEAPRRSEEHTSELQSLAYLVCRLLLEKKKRLRNHQAGTRLLELLYRRAA